MKHILHRFLHYALLSVTFCSLGTGLTDLSLETRINNFKDIPKYKALRNQSRNEKQFDDCFHLTALKDEDLNKKFNSLSTLNPEDFGLFDHKAQLIPFTNRLTEIAQFCLKTANQK